MHISVQHFLKNYRGVQYVYIFICCYSHMCTLWSRKMDNLVSHLHLCLSPVSFPAFLLPDNPNLSGHSSNITSWAIKVNIFLTLWAPQHFICSSHAPLSPCTSYHCKNLFPTILKATWGQDVSQTHPYTDTSLMIVLTNYKDEQSHLQPSIGTSQRNGYHCKWTIDNQ